MVTNFARLQSRAQSQLVRIREIRVWILGVIWRVLADKSSVVAESHTGINEALVNRF